MIIKTRMVKCDRVTEDSAKTSSATKPCLSYSPTFISTIASGRPSAVAFNRIGACLARVLYDRHCFSVESVAFRFLKADGIILISVICPGDKAVPLNRKAKQVVGIRHQVSVFVLYFHGHE